jgi:hypothetical protein
MSTVLAYLNTTLVACAVCFAVGVIFSQKIKDWFHGIPSDLRAGLNKIESAVLGHLTATTQSVVAQVQAQLPTVPPVAPEAPKA